MAISTHETRFILTAKDRTKGVLKSTQMNLRQVGKAVTGVHAQLLALAGVGGFAGLLGGIINTNTEMQRLNSSLKTVTGSGDAAADAFEKIQKFAVTTPFDLNQWTEAFIKMKALGLDPSEAALTSYGNTAAAMGKSLNQMIEAVADAATGEFERLKEFGIRASKQGEEVQFTFQGVTTTIANNSAAISKYLQDIGNNNFAGAMNDQMQNLGPAFSNLRQSFATLAVKIGESGLNDLVRDITLGITDFTNSLKAEDVQSAITSIAGGLYAIKETVMAIRDGWAGIVSTVGGLFMPDSGIGTGTGRIPGGYQLGDFNRSGGDLGTLQGMRDFDAMRGERSKEQLDAMKENNQWQQRILEAIREQQGGAIAQ